MILRTLKVGTGDFNSSFLKGDFGGLPNDSLIPPGPLEKRGGKIKAFMGFILKGKPILFRLRHARQADGRF
jgi:hypothetical protein